MSSKDDNKFMRRALDLALSKGRIVSPNPKVGAVLVNGERAVETPRFALMDRGPGAVTIAALTEATVLALSGEPIDEPIAMRGPFVMNSSEEIGQAIADFESGRFGHIHA